MAYKNAVLSPVAFGSLSNVPHLLSFVDHTVCIQHELPVSVFSVILCWSPLLGALLTVANSLVLLALHRHSAKMDVITSFLVVKKGQYTGIFVNFFVLFAMCSVRLLKG
jgi:hypothetical protein